MRKEEIVNIFVVFFFLVGFFLLVVSSDSVTGFIVSDIEGLEEEVEVIISLEGEYSENDNIKSFQDKFVKLNNLSLEEDYDNINAISIKIKKEDLEDLLEDEKVKSVTLDQEFKISLSSSKSVINADLIWDKLSNGINLTGSGSVCVLDTGIDYNNPALTGRVILGYDFVNEDSDPMDDHIPGHGTHVAGIISSLDNIYRGIANGANVVAVKVMNSAGGGSGSDVIAGIDWCINNKDNYNITAISMSIGAGLFSSSCDSAYPEMTNIINEAVGAGILVVSSAGNDGSSDSISLPGCITNVTSVGAVSDDDSIASFSNRGSIMDLFAPGVSITSTVRGGFGTMSGTSMAAPHVSAAITLVKQYSELEGLNVDVVSVLKENGVLVSGFPRIDLYEAILSLDSFAPILSYDSIGEVYDDKDISLNVDVSDTFLDTVVLEVLNESYYGSSHILNFEVGNISFRFSANDSNGNFVISNWSSFEVLDGSPIVNDVSKLVAEFGRSFDYQVLVVDPTNDSLEYSDNSLLFNISSNGLISFVPNELGNDSVTIYIYDGKHNVSDNFILEVVLNNTAPNITSYSPEINVSLDENESVSFSIVKEDVDGGSLSVGWYLDGVLVENLDEYLFETNYTSSGSYNLIVNVSDGIDSDFVNWDITVNDINLAPEFIGLIENISFNENTNYSLDLVSYFIDLDDSLSFNMSSVDNISFVGDVLIVDDNFVGVRNVLFYGCDEVTCAESNLVGLTVNNVPVCGDSLVESDEECDLSNLDDKSCSSFDYDSGSLSCDSCSFDYSSCVITLSAPSGSPSGGGGTSIKDEFEEVVKKEVKIEEKKVEEKSKLESEDENEITGDIVKEAVKPEKGLVTRVFTKIGGFFKGLFSKIVSIFR